MSKLHAEAIHDNRRMHVIERHFARHVAPERGVFHEITSAAARGDVHVDVHIVPPGRDRPFTLLFTSGMSAGPMNVPAGYDLAPYAELAMLIPQGWAPPWTWPVQWLVDLARLPHRYNTWLGYGHTVPNGDPARPFDANTQLAGVILGPSTSLPDEAQTIRDGDVTIDVFTVWPIHAAEMSYKLARGADELFAELLRADVTDIVDPQRPSVV